MDPKELLFCGLSVSVISVLEIGSENILKYLLIYLTMTAVNLTYTFMENSYALQSKNRNWRRWQCFTCFCTFWGVFLATPLGLRNQFPNQGLNLGHGRERAKS